MFFPTSFNGAPISQPNFWTQNSSTKRSADELSYYEGTGQGGFSGPITQMGPPNPNFPPNGTDQATTSFQVYRDAFGNPSTSTFGTAQALRPTSKRARFNPPTKTPPGSSGAFFDSRQGKTPTKKSHKRARSLGGANRNILLHKNVNELRDGNAQYKHRIRKTLSPELLMRDQDENGAFPCYDGSSPLSSVQGSTKLGHRYAKRRAGYEHFQALLENAGKADERVDEFGKVLEEYSRGF
ncbi:hypothetical protein DFH27DRAFT_359659 [Peziza echinospora]|nr:hypothetical protein DFH27DRAFT_359659 [Peziza echinospora]